MRTKAQQEAAKRDGKFCLWCINTEYPSLVIATDVHHMAHRQPGADKSELCMNLCHKCHMNHHNARWPTTTMMLDLMFKVYGFKLRDWYPKFFANR